MPAFPSKAVEKLLGWFREYKAALILVLTPILFSCLAFSPKKEWRCAFCLCVMAVYWISEVLPIAVTAMLPLVVFPLTGVLSGKEVARYFINEQSFLLTGGLIVAAAVEKCNLHKRVALSMLKLVGSDPKWIMLGFMTVTALLRYGIGTEALARYNSPSLSQHPYHNLSSKVSAFHFCN